MHNLETDIHDGTRCLHCHQILVQGYQPAVPGEQAQDSPTVATPPKGRIHVDAARLHVECSKRLFEQDRDVLRALIRLLPGACHQSEKFSMPGGSSFSPCAMI